MIRALVELLAYVSHKRRRQLATVVGLMLVSAFAELVSIGAILPFLAIVANPLQLNSSRLVGAMLRIFRLTSSTDIMLAATIAFVGSVVFAAGVRLVLVWVSQRFVFGIAHELSVAIYRRVLYQPFTYHTLHNSSETLAAINKAQTITTDLLIPLVQAFSAGVIALAILVGLFAIDFPVALASGVGFAGIYVAVILSTGAIMRRNGSIMARAYGERLQTAAEGLGGIRDVLIDHSQEVFIGRFDGLEQELRKTQAVSKFVGAAPRFIVEGLGMVLIATIVLILGLKRGGIVTAIPTLGALALGAQRMLPLLQQIYVGWTESLSNGRMLDDILGILRLSQAPLFTAGKTASAMKFNHDLRLENVSYFYPLATHATIKGISLTIRKGSRVAFIGKTGSGKSTLIDLIVGLLTPTAGRILVDGVELTSGNCNAWQAQLAHVPQSIYLADATLAENIAFGVRPSEIDQVLVRHAAEQAELAEVIDGLQWGYDTMVGERGIRLSGGQRQRIAIARALYKQANILIFDEATNALDPDTENAVMSTISNMSRELTIMIIAHRFATIGACDEIFKIEEGHKVEIRDNTLMSRSEVSHNPRANVTGSDFGAFKRVTLARPARNE